MTTAPSDPSAAGRNAVGIESSDLLDALCICSLGWQTEDQHKRYLAANELVLRHARKLHLLAELKALEAEASNGRDQECPTTEPTQNTKQ